MFCLSFTHLPLLQYRRHSDGEIVRLICEVGFGVENDFETGGIYRATMCSVVKGVKFEAI